MTVIPYVLTLAQSGEMAPKKLRAQVKKLNGSVKLRATFKIGELREIRKSLLKNCKIGKQQNQLSTWPQQTERIAKIGFYNGLSGTSTTGGFYSGPSAHIVTADSLPLTATYYPMRWSPMMPGNILRCTDEFSPLSSAATLMDNKNSFGSSSNLMGSPPLVAVYGHQTIY